MTNERTPGAHRPENVTGPAPAFTEPPRTSHAGATPAAGVIRAESWRMAADAVRADNEYRRALRSIERRG